MTLFEVTQYVCLPIIIGILTLAFPILLQSISRIDEKYNTSVLIKVFRNECLYKWFNRILYFSLVAVFIHFTLQAILSWLFNLSTKNTKLIENISSSILIFFTIVLIVIVIRLIKLIMTYYDHSELLQRISQRFKSFDDENTAAIDAYRAIANFILSKNDDRANGVKIIYETLGGYTKEKYEKGEDFSNSFYTTFSTLNKTLCQQKSEPFAVIKGDELLNVLLPQKSSPKDVIISNKTYAYLFMALRIQLEYGQTEWVYEYWQRASMYKLNIKYPVNYAPNNHKNEVDEQEQEEKIKSNSKNNQNFDEFHIWLATMILHKKEYLLLSKILAYSNVYPISYPLVQSNFRGICRYFVNISKFMGRNPFAYRSYSFSDTGGIKASEVNKGFMNKYLALLLFRLNSADITDRSYPAVWTNHKLPTEIKELHNWLKQIKVLKTEAKNWNRNRNDEAFNAFEIVPEREIANNPIEKLDKLIKDIEKKIEELEQEGNN